MRKHTHGLGVDDSDRLSAIATGLFSLGKGLGHLHGQPGGDVRQVVVEHDGALLFVSAAGAGAVLAVLASGEADPALIGYEMAQLVKSVAGYLSTPPRGSGL